MRRQVRPLDRFNNEYNKTDVKNFLTEILKPTKVQFHALEGR